MKTKQLNNTKTQAGRKVLVLENVSEMEEVLRSYLSENFADAEIEVIYNLGHAKPETIIEKLKWCDTLAIQSIFNRTDQMENFITMIETMKLNPEVHLIHSTKRLLHFINMDISIPARVKLMFMLEKGLKVFNVYHETMQEARDDESMFKGKYFSKLFHFFDAVPLWWNKQEKLVWDERPPQVVTYDLKYYKPKVKIQAQKQNWLDALSASELKEFKQMLSETYYDLETKLEDLEEPHGLSFDEKETEELRTEHNRRKKILDKLKITSFR